LKTNDICIAEFVKNYRKTLRTHLDSGFVEYARDGYVTLIKIIEDEIESRDQIDEVIRRMTLEVALELNEIRPLIGEKVFNLYFSGSSLIRSALDVKKIS
tara:strand:- start:4965 stop:5264 length:300 start_codon:yes stop_codon:yes gene_type:complete